MGHNRDMKENLRQSVRLHAERLQEEYRKNR